MENKRYIYTYSNRLGRTFTSCANNKRELGKIVSLDLIDIIDRTKNVAYYQEKIDAAEKEKKECQ